MEPLAHSAPKSGFDPQTYSEHALNCRLLAKSHAASIAKFAQPSSGWNNWVKSVETSGEWHDLGKLDPENQDALRTGRGSRLKQDHVDAGVAHTLSPEYGDEASAWLIRSHHSPGLPSARKESVRKRFRLRGKRSKKGIDDDEFHRELVARNNAQIDALVDTHVQALCGESIAPSPSFPAHGIGARLALSCLVDGDHSDAGRFDREGSGSPISPARKNCRWEERLEKLKSYIAAKQEEGKGDLERNRIRQVFFESCLGDPLPKDTMFSCEASVGLGKTTSVLAYLLRQAAANQLRRIVIVAPFTNILHQTAKILASALLLPGENREDIILEHHHRAEFSSQEFRDLSVTWDAPVILTTAVQFFETLGSNHPGTLRKLHRLPGSAIFIDEAHASLPFDLWPQCFEWLRELSCNWSCPTALVSGSQVRFWEERWGRPKKAVCLKLPEITPDEVSEFSQTQEIVRCQLLPPPPPLDANGLAEIILNKLGEHRNQLVILNTVHSTAGFARRMAEQLNSDQCDSLKDSRVLHLSTLLTPIHRKMVLNEIERRTTSNNQTPSWLLIATSCVEAGIDLDFHDGFREDASMSSLIQTSGRINRHGKFKNSTLTRVILAEDPLFRPNPQFKLSAQILDTLFHHLQEGKASLTDIATAAVCDELESDQKSPRFADIIRAESEHDYPTVAELCKVIQTESETVLVNQEIARNLKAGKPVSKREIMEHSVQLWASKISGLGLESLTSKNGHVQLYLVSKESYDHLLLGLGSVILDAACSKTEFCSI